MCGSCETQANNLIRLLSSVTPVYLFVLLFTSIYTGFASSAVLNDNNNKNILYFLQNISSFLIGPNQPHSITHSPSQRPLVSYREMDRGKKKARGGRRDWKRRSEAFSLLSRLFPLAIVPRALFIFRLLLFLLRYSAEASAEEKAVRFRFHRKGERDWPLPKLLDSWTSGLQHMSISL